jgi:C_GCAxxG_C_C family probable redox protein
MSKLEKVISNFMEDFNCAQSIFGAYAENYGLDENAALKVATGFGGGMGRSGRTCGAVTGSYMVIGLKYGTGLLNNKESKEKTYEIINEFTKRFIQRNGSVLCKELLGCDINTSEGREYYDQNNYFEKKCLQYVKNAAEILEELI